MLTEALLLKQKQFSDEVIDSLPGIFYMLNKNGFFVRENQRFHEVSGYSKEELESKFALSFFEGRDKDSVTQMMREIIETGDSWFEAEFITKSKQKIPYYFSGHRIKVDNETFIIGLGTDISERKKAEENLREKHKQLIEHEVQYHELLKNLHTGIVVHAPDTHVIFSNLRASELLGQSEDQMRGKISLDPAWCFIGEQEEVMKPEEYPANRVIATQEPLRDLVLGVKASDKVKVVWLSVNAFPEFNADRTLKQVVVNFDDITEKKLAQERLRVAAVAFETHEAILITDANNNIISVNQAFQDVTGYNLEEVLGKNPRLLRSDHQNIHFYEDMWQQLQSEGTWRGEIWDKRKNGQIFPKWMTITAVKNNSGKTTEYVAIFDDLTLRKQAEEKIHNMAFFDALTNLPNRRLLIDRLHSALSVSSRSKQYGAVLFIDMDKFKTINDVHGHDYGDLMLIEVAERIKSSVREIDTVARLGGDEFIVLLVEIDDVIDAASQKTSQIAEKIRVSLSAPYQLNGNEQHSSPSIGASLYMGNEESAEVLLKQADIAMYQAKDAGRNALRFFNPAMQLAVEAHAALESDLRHAVPEQQLHLYYQIQVDSDQRPLGAEALVRWIQPTRGMISPMQFIPVAEESSLILDIGNWVLNTACQQLAVWAETEQTRYLTLAVNVSAQQFRQPDFVETVATALRRSNINASRLKLELTESVVLNDVRDVVNKMYSLKALGVMLSMDDFGTGYSSLSYLKKLPVDQIKIDQSFVRDIVTDPSDAVMVKTIIDLGKNFRLHVIAEGVETESQLAFLKLHGCMAYQGYLFGKPLPIEEFEELLKQ
jgi:diguanylate cyclase (GGDEF)-like protein/PAS domain S-box-containing protein